jgi:hypothetical protein
MNCNMKRKLLAGLFVPVLGLAVGGAFAQGTTGGAAGTGATSGSTSGGTAGSSATGSGASGTTGAGTSGAVGAGTSGMGGAATSGSAGTTGTASWNAQTFERLDTNHDGKLSREEAQADATLRGAWSQLDPGNTGSVSRADFERYRTTRASGAGTTSGMSGGTTSGSSSGMSSGSAGTGVSGSTSGSSTPK